MQLNSVQKKILTFLKVVIFVLLIILLYRQVTRNDNLLEVFMRFRSGMDLSSWILVCFALILILFNYGSDAMKWKLLIVPLEDISFYRSFKAVMGGVTLGIFTPNRIGEYGGRILFLKRHVRVQAILSTLVGSYSQIIATLSCGTVAGLFFLYHTYQLEYYSIIIFIFLGAVAIFLMLLGYLNISWVATMLEKTKRFEKLKFYLKSVDHYSNTDLLRVLVLSYVRFSVFTAQYLILLRVFGVDLSIPILAMLVSVIFLVQSIIPSFAIAELFTRGNIAVFFFGFYTTNTLGVVSASATLWFINLILPALFGYLFLFRLNLSNL